MNWEERQFELYKLAFEHSDKEVAMLWQRNAAFLVANSAFVLIVGVFRDSFVFATVLSVFGVAFAGLWMSANRYYNAWLDYWVRSLQDLESKMGLQEHAGFAPWSDAAPKKAKALGRPPLRLRAHSVYLASLFLVLWLTILVYSATLMLVLG